jgi:flagellar M-ring protein FliF
MDALSIDETEQHRVAFENRLRGKIVQLLERTLGPGKVDAAVSADLDFDEIATTAEMFDPSTQVVRSTQTTEEASDAKETTTAEAVSVANNLPTEQPAPETGPGTSERTNRTEETVNYEISRTVRNQTKRGSSVRKLSIAVQVDGIYQEDAEGVRRFEPRTAEELAQIEELVRSAAGADQARGDVVEVVSRPFLSLEAELPVEEPWTILGEDGFGRLIELGVFSALTLAVLLLGVRPLLRRLFPTAPAEGEKATDGQALPAEPRLLIGSGAEEAFAGAMYDPGPALLADASLAGRLGPSDTLDATFGTALLSGPETDGSPLLAEIARAIETRPEDAVRIIRDWLQAG